MAKKTTSHATGHEADDKKTGDDYDRSVPSRATYHVWSKDIDDSLDEKVTITRLVPLWKYITKMGFYPNNYYFNEDFLVFIIVYFMLYVPAWTVVVAGILLFRIDGDVMNTVFTVITGYPPFILLFPIIVKEEL